jgi:hypothetical protein
MPCGIDVEEMTMADDPRAIEVPGSWIGAEELPVQFANAFAGVVGPNAVFLNIGSVVPPGIVGDTEEELEAAARSLTFIPIKPIARLALAPAGLDELISTLEDTRTNYETLVKALKDQEGEAR